MKKFYLKGCVVLNWNDTNAYALLVKALNDDGVILGSSDTVLGLLAQLSEISKNKLDTIKQRNIKPYIVIIASAQLLDEFTDQQLDASMQHIIARYWPGPVTIIFKAKACLPGWMVSPQGTIAIRVPDHQGLQMLLQQKRALFTTSANLTDQPVPERFADVDQMVLNQVSIVCCDKDQIYGGLASTIVDFSSGFIQIIRSGVVVIDSN